MAEAASKAVLRGQDVAFFDVSHEGTTHRVQIKRVATARRFTLRVRAATRDVVLTMPPRGSVQRARLFVDKQAGWIAQRVARLPAASPFGPGVHVPIRGLAHAIAHRPLARGTVWVEHAPNDAAPLLCVSGAAPFVARRVKDWLMREARADLEAAVERHARTLGVAPRRVTLRDTRTRWGSCSAAGALNFSWRLIMAPPHVLHYLAAHEVAHLRHMNHSAAFWSVVATLDPVYEAAEAWLKRHGAGLMHYGAG